MKITDFEHKKLSSLALRYIIPSVFGMMFLSLQSIIDGFFISRYVGEHALASLNIVSPIISIMMAVSMVIAIGSQSLISIKLGADEPAKAQNYFRTAMLTSLVIGALLAILGASLARPIVRLLGASDLLVDNSAAYLRIIAFSAPFVCMWMTFDYSVRVLGKPHISMIGMILAAVLNITLDWVLLEHTNLGIQGAAIATAIAYTVACIACAIPLFNKKSVINIYKGKYDFKALGRMVYNGGSEGINSLAGAITVLVFNLTLMKYAGEDGVASYTAIMYIMTIGFSILFGISDGMRPIISYNYGANNTKRLRKSITLLFSLGMITGITACLIIFFGARGLAGLFVSSESIINMTVSGAKIVAFAFLFSNVNILASGFYTSINFAKESIIISLLRGCVFMISGVLVLPLIFGTDGIWGAFLFSDVMTFSIVAVMFIIQYKKKKFFRDGNKSLTNNLAIDNESK